MRLINGCTVTLWAKSTERISCKTHHTSHWNCSVLWCGAHFTPLTNTHSSEFTTKLTFQSLIDFKATENIDITESISINQLADIKITAKHPKYSFEAVLPKLSWGQQVVLPLLQVLELEIKTWADHATLKENSIHTWVHPVQNSSRNSNNFHILKTLAK